MATYISLSSGNWSSASTWLTAVSGVGPLSAASIPPQSFGGDKIIIRGGHTVTYDVSGCFGDQTSNWGQGTGSALNNTAGISANGIVLSGGTLKASRIVPTELSAWGNINIGVSGVLDWGTSTDPLTTTSNIYLHYMAQLSVLSASTGSAGIHLYGGTSINDAYRNGLYINGISKIRNTTLSASAASGSSILTLSLPISTLKWNVGDRLVVATESVSAVTTSVTTIPTTVLSATYIQSFTGNQVTISPNLNTFRSAGTCVGNFTSNVIIKSYNPLYPAYGIYVNGSNAFTLDIGNIKLESLCYGIAQTPYGNIGWTAYSTNGTRSGTTYTGNTQGMLTLNVPNTVPSSLVNILPIKGVVFENFTSATVAGAGLGVVPPPAYALFINGKYSDFITVDDSAIFLQNPYSMTGIQFGALVSVNFKNTNTYRNTYSLQYASTFPNNVIIDNSNLDATANVINGTFGLASTITNSKFRSPNTGGGNYTIALDGIQNLSIKNSTFISNNSAGWFFQPNTNAVGNIIASNCYFYNNNTQISAITKNLSGAPNVTGQAAQINIYQPNNLIYDYRRFNYYHYSQSDLANKKRGITSYKIKPEVANTKFYNYFTLNGVLNTPQRIKGSLRFDDNYGSTYPPSISFIGAGVNTEFTCEPTSNIWQDFDVTLNPTSTDDITMTITCQSSGRNGYVWFDGVPIYPFIQSVRHYGFVFDSSPDRTVNSLTTLTENQVSALGFISNLDELYDAANYWSIINPASSSYIDLYTVNGTVLDFGSKNIVINNTGTALSYISATNTIVLDAPSLSAGNNFNTLKTTGTVTLSTGLISNIDINANIIQNDPTNLTGIFMLSASNTLTYNTNTPIEIEYTNCTMVGVQNSGTAIITIKRTNSTVTENDAEIFTYAPTLINLTLQGGYIALYNESSIRQYYQNIDGTLVLPSNATGNWSYRISKYGYHLVYNNFTVNPNVGGTVDINPNYISDTYITENDVSTVSAYTNLNTPDKIHDYLSYYQTTSDGIDYGDLETESFGVINFNTPLTIDSGATKILDYSGGVLTLKASSITGDIIFVVNGNLTLSGTATLSDGIKVRSNNFDSEIYFNNITSITLYPTLNDRDNNTNPGDTESGTIYRFKYGSTYSGVTMTSPIYARVATGALTLIYTTPITTGTNTLDLGVVGTLQSVIENQKILNTGIQKSSKLIPHTTNLLA